MYVYYIRTVYVYVHIVWYQATPININSADYLLKILIEKLRLNYNQKVERR